MRRINHCSSVHGNRCINALPRCWRDDFLRQLTSSELLAHHLTDAGCYEQAIVYWQRAGERARQGSAHIEAIAHLTKALGS